MERFVKYDADGNLTGCFFQDAPNDGTPHFPIDESLSREWVNFKMNEARDGLVRQENNNVPPVPTVPEFVPILYAQQVLYTEGWLAPFEAILAAMPGPDGDLARIKWTRTPVVRRDDPLVAYAIAQLGKTAAEADDLFIKAAQLASMAVV